jgi:LmbE family N-acetylglucosaminyl deacetylase
VRGRSGRNMMPALASCVALASALLLTSVRAWSQAGIQAVADNISYNMGATVRLKVVYVRSEHAGPDRGDDLRAGMPVHLAVTIRYAGETAALLSEVPLAGSFVPSKSSQAAEYRAIWKIPHEARTGRYEIDLVARDSQSHAVVWNLPRATSFAVHRKLLRIERSELDKTFYTSGDPIGCRVSLTNLSDQPLRGLRVEFSERYWPWIAPSSERPAVDVVTLQDALALEPSGSARLQKPRAAVAKAVTQPTVQQYAVVVWDQERKDIYDIAFSPLAFIQPPGGDSRKLYPPQYIYPDLTAVDTSSYRQFIRPELNSAAIQFDRNHTMFASGSEASVKFSVVNPTDEPWRGVTIGASLRSLGSAEFGKNLLAEKIDLAPRAAPREQEAKFTLPSDGGGNYRVVVEVRSSSGEALASNSLELGVNPLPKSILIFCAHEDDEMAHAGIIRAAVENRIPLHLVYFTGGDAGSCDRYYQHSCNPAQAMNFGALRMEEARAALGHLGVPGENVIFLGLPDGGLGQIWSRHGEPANPYLSTLLASDHAPYEGLLHPNLPYARKSVVAAVKEVVQKLQPEVVYTAHPPNPGHVDHVVTGYLVVQALQELLREGVVSPRLELRVDRVYNPQAQPTTPYRYAEKVLHVSGEVMVRAQEAGWFYQSQGGNRAEGNLQTFSQLPRTQAYRQILDWKEHEGWNKKD